MTSDLVSPRKRDKPARELSPEQAAAAAMVAEAKARGLALTGPDGLLKLFTKNVLETALNEEMTAHLGYEKNRAEPGRETSNIRNGSQQNEKLKSDLTKTRMALDIMGKAHALLEGLSESAENDRPPRISWRPRYRTAGGGSVRAEVLRADRNFPSHLLPARH